jgi:hypothetical protein
MKIVTTFHHQNFELKRIGRMLRLAKKEPALGFLRGDGGQ